MIRKSKIEEKYKERKDEYEEYEKKIKGRGDEFIKQKAAYNVEIGTINAKRDRLDTLIKSLYGYLKAFGNTGDEITPFDFVNESLNTMKFSDFIEQVENIEMHLKNTGEIINDHPYAFHTVGIVMVPFALRNNRKEEYKNQTEKYEEEKTKYKKNIKNAEGAIKSLRDATEIAHMYYGVVSTVMIAIEKTIIPEISGVAAFLYAKVIAEKICYDEEFNKEDIKPDILTIQNTKYDEHYQFWRNTHDYYAIIKKIFTNRILTKIFEDGKINDEEKDEFNKYVEELKAKEATVKQHLVFSKGDQL